MFVSCGKQPKGNTEPDREAAESTSSEDSANNSRAYTTIPDRLDWLVDESNRIFTGELVSFDEDLSRNDQDQIYCAKIGKANLTIEVDGVYMGEYLVGTTVQEVYDYGVFSDINNPDFWEVGARYLFILGEFTEGILKTSVPRNSIHSVLKLDGSGKYELIDGSVDAKSYSHLYLEHGQNDVYGLFNYLFCVDMVMEGDYKEFYSRNAGVLKNGFAWDPGENFEYTQEDFYEIAEDVYYGEIIDCELIANYPELKAGSLYKIKVKVMTVYKGDLQPGEIIEDISFLKNGYQVENNPRISHDFSFVNRQFFLTGGALDLGYSLDSENSAS